MLYNTQLSTRPIVLSSQSARGIGPGLPQQRCRDHDRSRNRTLEFKLSWLGRRNSLIWPGHSRNNGHYVSLNSLDTRFWQCCIPRKASTPVFGHERSHIKHAVEDMYTRRLALRSCPDGQTRSLHRPWTDIGGRAEDE